MLCNISQNAMRQWRGGYPDPSPGGLPGSGTPLWGGYPGQVPPPGGYPGQVPPPGGVPGSGTPPGGVPGSGTPPGGGYPGRTTEGVLTTRRAVCLLRSRRRTFLLDMQQPSFYLIDCTLKCVKIKLIAKGKPFYKVI